MSSLPRLPGAERLRSQSNNTSPSSWWIFIGARNASCTSSIGGRLKLGRPLPMMMGATTTCSRSRQFATRKRETVSAPPSIKMRRNPRSWSAERIASGAIRRWNVCNPTISIPAGSCGFTSCAVITKHRTPSRANIFAAAGKRAPGSITTRAGLRPATCRTVSCGSSASAVPTPTNNGVDDCPQSVQVCEPRRTIDVV